MCICTYIYIVIIAFSRVIISSLMSPFLCVFVCERDNNKGRKTKTRVNRSTHKLSNPTNAFNDRGHHSTAQLV